MGNRLSKIVTRTGDGGTTGLADGSRVAKDSPRIAAIGAVDELNAVMGLLAVEALPPAVATLVPEIQHELFDLGGELSLPAHPAIEAGHVERLEQAVEKLNADLPRLKEFVLPGGTHAAAVAHLARTVCRRAERAVVTLAGAEPVAQPVRTYLNRLSDLLFVFARVINHAAGAPDVMWRHQRHRPS